MASLAAANRLDEACDVLDWMAEDGVEGNAVVYQVRSVSCGQRVPEADCAVGWMTSRSAVDDQHTAWAVWMVAHNTQPASTLGISAPTQDFILTLGLARRS